MRTKRGERCKLINVMMAALCVILGDPPYSGEALALSTFQPKTKAVTDF